jgi:hypothetical protein
MLFMVLTASQVAMIAKEDITAHLLVSVQYPESHTEMVYYLESLLEDRT